MITLAKISTRDHVISQKSLLTVLLMLVYPLTLTLEVDKGNMLNPSYSPVQAFIWFFVCHGQKMFANSVLKVLFENLNHICGTDALDQQFFACFFNPI